MQQTSDGVLRAVLNDLSSPVRDDGSRQRNRLLASLTTRALADLQPHLETVRLEQDEVLFEADQFVNHVYFLDTAAVLLVDVDLGRRSVAGTVGFEGMVGAGVFSGQTMSALRAVTYLPGTARRMTASAFTGMASVAGSMHQLMLAYGHSFLTQIIAERRCANAHSVVQRCARWILLTCQRADAAEFPHSLDILALVLGAQRGGVSLGLRGLEQRGLIDYRDGWVRVLDHQALAEATCDCTPTIPEI